MKNLPLLFMSTVLLLSACAPNSEPQVMIDNILLAKWDTPFGIPPFDKITTADYMPAYVEAMRIHQEEINAIVNNPKKPTFENTIVAYDRAGALLGQVSPVFGGISGANANPEILAIAKELSPLTSKHSDDIRLNPGLFKRVKEVYEKRGSLKLNPEQLRLVEETYKRFERGGANLPEDKQAILRTLNTEISALQTEFGQSLLAETAAYTLLITNKADLAGLSEDQIATAALRAQKAGKTGWLFGLDNPSIMPFLQSAAKRELRNQMLSAYLNRCNHNNENDTKEVIIKLINLRLQKAQLMGFNNFAEMALEDRMAKTPAAVYGLLDELWTPTLRVANQEADDIQAIMKKEGVRNFADYDWRYYSEKAKKQKFNLSDEELAPYFQLENVREGIFYVANQLYGITFTQLTDVPVPTSEALAFECKDKDGSHLGILFLDMFSRPGAKRAGAWCGSYRSQDYDAKGNRIAPLVTIVCNFTRPVGDKPALLTPDETETFFHEFGHGLHNLFKNVHYSGVSGVPRDFVELPSQIMEHWAFEPQVLKAYAKHYQTGEVIPQELIDKMGKAGKYGQGFATAEYLGAALLDMDYHVLTSIPADFDVLAFEAKTLGDRKLLPQIPPRYRSTYFNHSMAGGYTAGYYSYIWSEVLDSDAYEAFVETGNIFDQATATRFRKEILERGGQEDAMTMYKNFRGKEPGIEPLLKNRGLN